MGRVCVPPRCSLKIGDIDSKFMIIRVEQSIAFEFFTSDR
jgi:hypothetical protein